MNSSKDTELRHIARLRLARVLIDQGKPDDALNMLADPPGAFAARYHEVRGDAFFAKKDPRGRLKEYKAALGEGAGEQCAVHLLDLENRGPRHDCLCGRPARRCPRQLLAPADPSKKAKP